MRQDGHRLAFTSRIALRMTSAGCRALVTGVRCDVLHAPAGTWALDLRQWHAGSDAGLIPGKKGVRLGREQASALLAAAPLLDSKLNRKGERRNAEDGPLARKGYGRPRCRQG